MGYTKDTMNVTIVMNILNVIGNFFVIFGPFGFPVLGVVGVAYSTAISRLLGFIALIILLIKRSKGQLDYRRFYRYQKEQIKKLLQIGIPSAGEQLSYNASQMIVTYFVAQIGTVAITTKVYTQNIKMFIFLFSIAVGQGTQIMIGHLVGAGKHQEAYQRGVKSLRLAIIISIIMSGLVLLFAKPLLGIFTSDMSVIEMRTMLFMLTIILETGRAFNLVMINSLRAAGDVKFPVYIGIWISFIADEWVRGIFMFRRWRKQDWMSMSFVERA